ncbi:FAD-dependent oxidoreductase [Paenibacillus sp. YYML68]|uniref:dihydrolipoyl dehydrogenase family protein n=1 Tax=Paenibacillus sp. YYML68 TaxID=2909250 RepID=UPI00285278A7|nr:FAD-dependent oxidoreductase [Paenibacillus sp. YYML68]
MNLNRYDLVVIGGGAAGLTAAAGAASLGAKVALVEKEQQPGGDCLHYGCVPSKALIAAARQVHEARKAAGMYGLSLQGEPDLQQAMERVHAAIAHIQKHDAADRFRAMGVDVYQGFGTFRSAHEVETEQGERLTGKRLVIATGSRPFVPPVEGLAASDYATNEAVFSWKQLPASLLVIGGGAIGLELGQSFARLGSAVTIVDSSPVLLPREDEEVAAYVRAALDQELRLLLQASVMKVERLEGGKKRVTVKQHASEHVLIVDHILVAAGRRPNTECLGLERAGVETTNGYITVKDTLQTSVPHIYAAGDVLDRFPFTHAAGMEGKVVVSNAVFGLRRKVSYANVPWVTYTDPELFHLGLTEREARDVYGDRIRVYRVPLADVDRFVTDRDTDGLVKVVTTASGDIVGAHAVGKGAGDWAQELVFAKQHKHKIGDISHVIHPYPTHTASVQRAADQYWREKLFAGKLPQLLKLYLRWFR